MIFQFLCLLWILSALCPGVEGMQCRGIILDNLFLYMCSELLLEAPLLPPEPPVPLITVGLSVANFRNIPGFPPLLATFFCCHRKQIRYLRLFLASITVLLLIFPPAPPFPILILFFSAFTECYPYMMCYLMPRLRLHLLLRIYTRLSRHLKLHPNIYSS